MPPKPRAPSFGSHDYWDRRFTTNTAPFDWLTAPQALDPFISAALASTTEPQPHILHIGCGSSVLSAHLKTHVGHARQVHNVDYSQVVIAAEREREMQVSKGEGEGEACARWDAVDVLDCGALLDVCKPGEYAVIVDKSTSDAVSCADDVVCTLPYAVSTAAQDAVVDVQPRQRAVHALHLMAVHLALVAKPGARWIALSYTAERYPFLAHGADTADAGIPDPSLLWTVVGQHQIEADEMAEDKSGVTHRPKVYHYAYMLERSSTPLFFHNDGR